MAKGGWVAAGLGGLAALGVVIWGLRAPEPAPEPAAVMDAAGASGQTPQAAPDAAAPVPAAPDSAAADPAASQPPRFDVVRVDTAGLATIAGLAPAGSAVSVLLDGARIAEAKADGAGQFATIITLTPSEAPRLMGLVARLADGSEIAAEETVAIGPVVAKAPEPPPEITSETTAAATAAEGQADPVAAPEAPPALLLSDSGAAVLQGADPAAPILPVSIEAISYGAAGEVLLAGRASPEAALRIYLDDAALADTRAGEEGRWQAALTEVAPGLHLLRVDALGAGGKVMSRFETPFQREVPPPETRAAAPEAPAQSAPAAAPADPAPPPAAAPITITVQPGLTLWAIAQDNFGEGVMYVQVFEANRDKIKDPDLIYPGQVFTVPKP